MNKMTLTLVATLILSGCQATQRQNATTGQDETNSTTQGAIIGAIAGAAIGLATGDNAKERRNRSLSALQVVLQLAVVSVITLINKRQHLEKNYLIRVFKSNVREKINFAYEWKMALVFLQVHRHLILVFTKR